MLLKPFWSYGTVDGHRLEINRTVERSKNLSLSIHLPSNKYIKSPWFVTNVAIRTDLKSKTVNETKTQSRQNLFIT